MKNNILFVTVSLALILTACASGKKSRSVGSVSKTPKVLEIERKQRAKEEVSQDRKDRDRILVQKSKAQLKINPVLLAAAAKLSDRALYAELVGSYDRNNEIAFISRYQVFQKKYSKSPLADDAAYLAGLFSLANKNYGPALKHFNHVLRKYPSSNKAASALYAKGVALKKMELDTEANRAFARVKKRYPGSPEALRADTELALFRR
jgi:tetratricopeptide (TPR) repeat protein